MKVTEIMTEDVESVAPTASIFEVAQKMERLNVGAIPILDGEKLVGMVTDRDIVIRAVAKKMDLGNTKVQDIVSRDVVFATEDMDINEAAELMEDHQIRRLPVLNAQKRLCGIVSLGDIATAGGDTQKSGETLSEISTPSHPVQ